MSIGVLKQGNEAGRGKRRKITIRSPESIARSVYEERPPPARAGTRAAPISAAIAPSTATASTTACAPSAV